MYSNGLQAPEALYRAAKRNDFDRALVEEGILDEKDIAMIKQVFAEISGKKIGEKPPQTPVKSGVPPEVLAIAKAIEFSDFSEGAMKKAETELLKLIDRFIEDNNTQAMFHAVKLLRLVQKEDVEGIKRFGG